MTPEQTLEELFRGWRGDPAEIAVGSDVDGLTALLTTIERRRPKFHNQAACRDSTIDFTSKSKTERAAAFNLCGRCRVRAECLAWAFEIDDHAAILGGTDPAARRAMRRHADRNPS